MDSLQTRPSVALNGKPRTLARLTVAADLFHERGFETTSIRDLARAMNLNSATLYHHFANKQEILYAICLRLANDFNAEMLPVITARASALTRVSDAIKRHIRFNISRRVEVGVLLAELRSLSDDQHETIVHLQRVYQHALGRAIEDGVQESVFSVRDSRLAAQGTIDVISGVLRWYREGGRLTLDEIADSHARLIVAGLVHWAEGDRMAPR